ncbi:hypothetical protein GCM10009126_23590 [Rhodanobacter caeni]|uniref:Lipoprotein n=2 Tax=Rhodanobacter caeni TaxID=657654 RepID=A0ABN0UPY7_9GAMM
MPLRATTALILTIALTTGCSAMHGDPKNPTKNPHPVKRYEITATADSPGPWDSIKGYISYEVVNKECTPENEFLGVHIMPRSVGLDIEMKRIDEKTWKGSFLRDYMLDDDYYGLGVCHWDATSVTANFIIHTEAFGSGDLLHVFLQKGPQTLYFKKKQYWDRSLTNIGGLSSSADNQEVMRHPEDFFPITVAVKEITP